MDMSIDQKKPAASSKADLERARGRRNVAIALALGAFAFLFFVITILKFGGGHVPS